MPADHAGLDVNTWEHFYLAIEGTPIMRWIESREFETWGTKFLAFAQDTGPFAIFDTAEEACDRVTYHLTRVAEKRGLKVVALEKEDIWRE